MPSRENCDGLGKPVFIGWDVGGWNCGRNPNSRDAPIVLDHAAKCVGEPFWGNLRTTINDATSPAEFLLAHLALRKINEPERPQHATIAIDASLGFPEAFTDLITSSAPVGHIGQSDTNPCLFRRTERRLADEGIRPLSAIKDMIGSQATKAVHVFARHMDRRRPPDAHRNISEALPCPARAGTRGRAVSKERPRCRR